MGFMLFVFQKYLTEFENFHLFIYLLCVCLCVYQCSCVYMCGHIMDTAYVQRSENNVQELLSLSTLWI